MITRRSSSRSAAFAVAACLARGGAAVLRTAAPGGRARWERTNFAGRTVELYAGPAAVLAAVAGAARVRPAVAGAVLAAGACGAYDDLVGAGDPRRGFRAHLGALRRGEVTGGTVKLGGICAAGLLAGALLKERPVDRVLAGVVIAGAAHFVNLVDVRPGRAAGAVLAPAAPGLLRAGPAGELAAVATGVAAAVLPDDLGERAMLGDTGAHALGALLGAAVVVGNGRPGLAAHAAAVVGAAVCGERVSGVARVPWGARARGRAPV
ncbi:hypothetical protein OG342_09890 [Streptomyces bobili]|uniref:hypothetical protein n=1 Tax=Streptomyces bobili TaxID=67280 RepID=UPI002255F72A|nr:hypothetical protein [Streptomyces bobili]MCX5523168.1 hypothetical protein [Streptomyces bobili]